MVNFRFSCDTNILISSSFYYRFRSFNDVFVENNLYHYSIFIMRTFEKIFKKTKKKFGILTRSILVEIKDRMVDILLRKIEEKYKKDASLYRQVMNEYSALLNKIYDNIERNLTVFEIGKANINDTRVKKIFAKVNDLYADLEKKARNLEEEIEEKVFKHVNAFFSSYYRNSEDLIQIEIEKENARQCQVAQLIDPSMRIGIVDKEILAEIAYEKKRCVQETPILRKKFEFYFVTEDTHFSQKHMPEFKLISRGVTDEILKRFGVNCVRAKQFVDLINKKDLSFDI